MDQKKKIGSERDSAAGSGLSKGQQDCRTTGHSQVRSCCCCWSFFVEKWHVPLADLQLLLLGAKLFFLLLLYSTWMNFGFAMAKLTLDQSEGIYENDCPRHDDR